MKTRSEKVKEFTEQSLGVILPDKPRVLTRDEVFFIIRMNLEELQELAQTVILEDETPKQFLQQALNISNPPRYKEFTSEVEIIAEQADAFVDIDYYNNNTACKAGMNVDSLYDIVHDANMAKRFPDGTFHKNDHGKIIKPYNWMEPNIIAKVEQWLNNGSW